MVASGPTAALFQLVAAFTSAAIAVTLYPVLKEHAAGMALGAVAFRLIEGAFYALSAAGTMILISLAGTILGLVAGLLVLFQSIAVLSGTQVVLNLPIFVQEMVLGVWLIVKGFSPKAPAPPPAEMHPAGRHNASPSPPLPTAAAGALPRPLQHPLIGRSRQSPDVRYTARIVQ